MRRIRMVMASLAVTAALLIGTTAQAAAYGGGANHDMWQVGISFNCNNPDFCAKPRRVLGLGEFDRSADGTETWGDAEGAGCFHTLGGGGGAGAVHISLEIESWTIAMGSAGPQTFFANGEETDNFRGNKVTFDLTHFDTGVPAVPGHYSAD